MGTLHFGEHVTIDGYGGDPKLLDSKKAVVTAIRELCKELHMRPLARMQAIKAPDNHIKDPGGWSAIQMIAESHISVHTFPRRQFVSADVYTCKNGIDVDYVVEFFKKRFKLEDVEVNFIKRGTRYPEHNLL